MLLAPWSGSICTTSAWPLINAAWSSLPHSPPWALASALDQGVFAPPSHGLELMPPGAWECATSPAAAGPQSLPTSAGQSTCTSRLQKYGAILEPIKGAFQPFPFCYPQSPLRLARRLQEDCKRPQQASKEIPWNLHHNQQQSMSWTNTATRCFTARFPRLETA